MHAVTCLSLQRVTGRCYDRSGTTLDLRDALKSRTRGTQADHTG